MTDRIRALLALRQLTPTQFADLIQVGRPIVSHILSGRNKASLDVVQRIIAAFPEVSLPWLLTGIGAMLAESVPGPVSEAIAASPVSPVPADLPTEPDQQPQQEKPLLKPLRPPVNSSPSTPDPSEISSKNGTPALEPVATADLRVNTQGHPFVQRFQVSTNKQKTYSKNAWNAVSSASQIPAVSPAGSVSLAADNATAERSGPPSGSAGSYQVLTPVASTVSAPVNKAVVDSAPIIPTQSTAETPLTAAFAAGTAEKPIRRIVIFYRDGSFTDFQPES